MPELGPYGSVRGARGNPRPYRDFHKRSMDKSGKCNAFARGNDNSVIGVLFSFDPAERAKLV